MHLLLCCSKCTLRWNGDVVVKMDIKVYMGVRRGHEDRQIVMQTKKYTVPLNFDEFEEKDLSQIVISDTFL